MIGNAFIYLSMFLTLLLYTMAKIDSPTLSPSLWQILAQLSGLFGLLLLSWSYILAVRHKWLEKIFGGLDKVYRIHHIIGGTAFLLLLDHPLFLIINALPNNLAGLYLIPGTTIDYSLGIVALYTLLILIIFTLFVDLPYSLWKRTHEFMGVVIILGGLHGLIVTSDIARYAPLRIYMLSFAIFAIIAYIYKRYLYYYLLPKNNYRLVESKMEGDILTIAMSPVELAKKLDFDPGQYAFVSTDNQKSKRDENPFSVLSVKSDLVYFAVKTVGLATLAISKLPIGSVLTLRGPFGQFGSVTHKAKDMVWIAGGIGITPFVYMAESLKPGHKATLFHSIKGSCSSYIDQVLTNLSLQNQDFEYIKHESKQGRLTGSSILNSHSHSRQTMFMLCGPSVMMESMTEQLVNMGVSRKRIIYEDFNFK